MQNQRPRQLHLLTRPDDELARTVIDAQRRRADVTVITFDLSDSSGQGAPDYEAALQAIFAADSVAVW